MIFLETYPPDVSVGDFFVLMVFFGGIFLLYSFRNIPIIGKIWYVVKVFFIVLLVTLAANFAKDEIKKWWDK